MKLIKLSTLVLLATSFIACDKGSESSFSENLSATTGEMGYRQTSVSLYMSNPYDDSNKREANIY